MSELGRLSTIVEEVIATSQGTSFYVQTSSGEGAGPGTFLTQDEGESGLGSGISFPDLLHLQTLKMLQIRSLDADEGLTKFTIEKFVKCKQMNMYYMFVQNILQRVRRRLWCMQLRI